MYTDQSFLNLIKLIHYRRDYNQSNGGNISYKKNGYIYIKPSGVHIGELSSEDDYFCSEVSKFNSLIDSYSGDIDIDTHMGNFVEKNFSNSKIRPSIETVLHTQLKRFTLHIHSLSSTILCSQKNWKEEVKKHFEDTICLDYFHPGLELGLRLKEAIQNFGKVPSVIFLQNHGIIISKDCSDELYKSTISIHDKLDELTSNDSSKHLKNGMPLFDRFTNDYPHLTLHSIDQHLSDEEIRTPFLTPDILIHCGAQIIRLDNLSNMEKIFSEYNEKYNRDPHIISHNNYIYVCARNRSEALEIEEVFKIQINMLRSIEKSKVLHLSQDSREKLVKWKAGKWRRK